jgi:hypothetical protein
MLSQICQIKEKICKALPRLQPNGQNAALPQEAIQLLSVSTASLATQRRLGATPCVWAASIFRMFTTI